MHERKSKCVDGGVEWWSGGEPAEPRQHVWSVAVAVVVQAGRGGGRPAARQGYSEQRQGVTQAAVT